MSPKLEKGGRGFSSRATKNNFIFLRLPLDVLIYSSVKIDYWFNSLRLSLSHFLSLYIFFVISLSLFIPLSLPLGPGEHWLQYEYRSTDWQIVKINAR